MDIEIFQLVLIFSTVLALRHGGAAGGKKVFIFCRACRGDQRHLRSDQLSAAGAEYDRSRKMMADDVNAAIRGARAGGATTIVVNDSHGRCATCGSKS